MIRPYKSEDRSYLINIFKLNTPTYFGLHELPEFEDYLNNYASTYFTIEYNNVIAGSLGYELRKSDKSGRINWIFIHPEFKGKGIGKKAVEHCLQILNSNIETEKLIVRTSQLAARFFEQFGYKTIYTEKDFWGPGIDLYTMEMLSIHSQKKTNNLKSVIEVFDKHAKTYQEKFMDLNLYNDTYDVFCDLVFKPQSRILEIGCGPGNITKYLLSERPDFKIMGIDVAPKMIKLAEFNNPSATFRVMDCREIKTLNEKFDAVICGFCLPFLSKEDCLKLIADSSHLLNSEGVFYFSAIEDDYDKSAPETSSDGKDTLFVYYHQEDYLMEACLKNNFELMTLKRKRYEKSNGTSATHIIFIVKKR